MSKTDDGNFFKKGEGYNALNEIGQISPYNWVWSPRGFYDNNQPIRQWAKWHKRELIPYEEMKHRIQESAKLNNANQEIKSGWAAISQEQRDRENCFRIVELGIPKGEKVTILASPRVLPGSDRKITFVSPDYTRTEEDKIGAEIQSLLKSQMRDS